MIPSSVEEWTRSKVSGGRRDPNVGEGRRRFGRWWSTQEECDGTETETERVEGEDGNSWEHDPGGPIRS